MIRFYFSSDKDFSFSKAKLVGWGNDHSRPRLGRTTSSYRRGEEIHGDRHHVSSFLYLHGTFTKTTLEATNGVIFDERPNFMVATWIRESDGSFFEAWIVSFQKGVLCLEGSCLSTESQLGRPKLLKVCVLPTWNLSLLEKLRAES